AQRQGFFDFSITQQYAALHVNRDHLARSQSAVFYDFVWLAMDNASLRGDDEHALRCQRIASGAQSIAIKRGPDEATVAKDERGGTIPGFDLARVILAPCLLSVVQLRILLPCRRYQHLHAMQQVASRMCQQFKRVIKLSRIAAGWLDDRQEIFDLIIPQR